MAAPAARLSPQRTSRKLSRIAYVAAALAFSSAALSLFWRLGRTWLLDTRRWLDREAGAHPLGGALLLGGGAILTKVVAASLALALVRPWGGRLRA